MNNFIQSVLWNIGEFEKTQEVTASFILGLNGKTLEELSKIILCLKFQVDSYTFSGTKVFIFKKSLKKNRSKRQFFEIKV